MKKIVFLLLFSGLALMVSGCEKSAQERLAEKTLKEQEEAKIKYEAYKKRSAEELERLNKRYPPPK